MTVVFRDKNRAINVHVSLKNEEILDLVEELTAGKGMGRSDSLFDLSERMLNQMAKAKGGMQWHLQESRRLWSD